MGNVAIWKGKFAKILAKNGIELFSGSQIFDLGATDPTAGAGVEAPVGSIGFGTAGLFIKTGAGNTAWGGAGGGGVTAYANFAALPPAPDDGTLAITLDTHILYEYNSTAVAWQALSTPGTDITSLNSDATTAQTISVGSTGTDFAIVDNGTGDHKLNLPVASAINTGKLSSTDWSTFNGKQNALGFTPENILNKGQPSGYASLDASGLVPLTQMPPSAIERLVIVADQVARFALTTATVQNGDTVKQTDVNEMFYVIDDTNLGNSAGYAVYAAGTAASVPYSGVTGVPTANSTTTGVLTFTDFNTFKGKESSLGNPAVDGYVLTSTAAGVRSWVADTDNYLPLVGGTMTGAIVGNAASGAKQVIKPLADSTTALQFQNAAGTNIVNVDSTNSRVGIGTAAPATQLHIEHGAVAANQMGMRIKNASSGQSWVLDVGIAGTDETTFGIRNVNSSTYPITVSSSSNNVGIGTAVTGARLGVVDNALNVTASFTQIGASSSSGGAGMLGVHDDGAAMALGDRLGYVSLGGAKDASHTIASSASIQAFATENWSGTAVGTSLTFSVTPNTTTTRTEAMRINPDTTLTLAAPLPIASGGTSQTTAPLARQALGTEEVFNGLEDNTKFAIAYSAANRQFTITYTAGAAYTVGGVRYTKTGSDVTTAHASTTGLWFCYYDASGVLTVSSTPWDLLTTAPIAAAYYTTSNNGGAAAGIPIDERHPGSTGMANATHKYEHQVNGTQIISGGVLSGYTLATNTLAAQTWGTTAATLFDEDLSVTAAAVVDNQGLTTTPYRIFWRTGTTAAPLWNWVDSLVPYYTDGTQINSNLLSGGNWSLSPVVTNLWVNYWVLGTTAASAPQIIVIMGNTQHASLAAAQASTFISEVADIAKLTTEGVVLYRTTFRRAGGGNATANCQLADVATITASIVSVGDGAVTAAVVSTDTTNFDNLIAPSDTTVQKALDRIDDHTHASREKNYIKDGAFVFPTADAQALLNWVQTKNTTVATAANCAAPEVNPGGTPDAAFTFLSSTTSPLMGSYSALLTHPASDVGGNSWKYAFTLDRCDFARVVAVSFDYEVASGTMADGDISVWLIANPGASGVLIQPAPYQILNGAGPQRFFGEFQTTASDTAYQLVFQSSNKTITAFGLRVDNLICAPRAKTFGAPVTDWQSYTPSWLGGSPSIGNGTLTGKWRRVGDSVELSIAMVSGTTTTYGGGNWAFSLPTGVAIDTSKVSLAQEFRGAYGTARYQSASGAVPGYIGVVAYADTVNLHAMATNADGNSGATFGNVAPFSPASSTAGNSVVIKAEFPVQGWSSSTQISSDAATRRISFRADRNGVAATLAPNAGFVQVLYNSVSSATGKDDSGTYDTSGSKYVVSVPGRYHFDAKLATASGANVLANRYFLSIQKGGVEIARGQDVVASAGNILTLIASGDVDAIAGEYFQVFIYGAGNNSSSTMTMDVTNAVSYFSGFLIQGPASIAASDTAAAQYNTTANTSLVNATPTPITTGWSRVVDTLGGFSTSTGIYTVQTAGIYSVSGTFAFANNSSGARYAIVYKDNVIQQYSFFASTSSGTAAGSVNGVLVRCLAGAQLEVRPQQTSGGNLALTATAGENWVSFLRVGNY